MRPPAITLALTLMLALACLGGCGGGFTTSGPSPLGRPLAAVPGTASATAAPAPSGDPPRERNGRVPQSLARGQDTPSSLAPSPHAALLRYALLYTNWQAASLPAHERRLVSMAVGAARLTAEQIAASTSAVAELAAHHVQNRGVVLAIAPGRGSARGQWIVVTQEQTSGSGSYAGLPQTLHVTFARTQRLSEGWAVSGWTPRV